MDVNWSSGSAHYRLAADIYIPILTCFFFVYATESDGDPGGDVAGKEGGGGLSLIHISEPTRPP